MVYNETPTIGRTMKKFLKNREIRVRLANTQTDNEDPRPTLDEILTPDSVKLIEQAGKRFVKNLALTVVGVVVAVKIVDVLGEIAVKKTRSADNED